MKRTRKKKLLIALGICVFVLLLFAGTAEYTSHSKFCSVCHYMKPFYQSWEESAHAGIECSKCHYPPGLRSFLRVKLEGLNQVLRYWTKLYVKSKPWAEIPDESCLRPGCHEKRLLEGRVQFQKVVFDHKVHLEDLRRGKRLRCTSCHSQIVQGDHITVTESSCFICHFKASDHYPEISSCSHCHTRESLVSEKISRYNHAVVFENNFACDKCHSQIIRGDGAVAGVNCYKCHFERDRLDRFDDTDLMHSTHISAHKIECNQCHEDIQHRIVKDIEAIADCRTCHTNFHQAQKILYAGEGGRGVGHARPNVMLEKGLSCKGCHMFHEEAGGRLLGSGTLVSRRQACESCHGKGFGRLLQNWQSSTEKKLREIKSVYGRALAEAGRAPEENREKVKSLLQDAGFNIDVVERGKSVHNMSYAQDLLQAAFGRVEEALKLAGSAYRPARFSVSTSDIPGQCSQCHAGIEEISAEIFGLSFPHKPHLLGQKMDCGVCHSNEKRHGEFVSSKNSCAACHHEDAERECGSCHALQKTIYAGGAFNGLTVPKDIMAEAGVGCDDCHQVEKGRVNRSDASTCAGCHEESYKQTFADWQTAFKDARSNLEESLREKKKPSLSQEEKALVAEVEKTLRRLNLDGSSGVHNSQFMEEVLTKLGQRLKSVREKAAND
jgi:hypothetical protein